MAKIIQDLAGGELRLIKYPVSGKGTAIVRGSILKRDAGSHIKGIAIVLGADDACTDVYGLLEEDHAVAGDSVITGGVWTPREITVNPKAIYEVEYSRVTADLMTAVSSSGTTVTIANLENDIDGGWLYVVSGTGVGQLREIAASVLGSCTTMTAFSPALDGTSLVMKILPIGHKLASFKAGGRFLQTVVAAGSGVVNVLENVVSYDGLAPVALDPTKHNGMLIPAANLPKFAARLTFPNHIAG